MYICARKNKFFKHIINTILKSENSVNDFFRSNKCYSTVKKDRSASVTMNDERIEFLTDTGSQDYTEIFNGK